jgi:hypothetical protein
MGRNVVVLYVCDECDLISNAPGQCMECYRGMKMVRFMRLDDVEGCECGEKGCERVICRGECGCSACASSYGDSLDDM